MILIKVSCAFSSAEKQRQLVDSVKNIVRDVDAADAVEMLALLNGNLARSRRQLNLTCHSQTNFVFYIFSRQTEL